jgi:C4-dicarboxylate transporter DctM subunit
VVACALFAAVSGFSPATAVAIGSIIMPAMVRQLSICSLMNP